MDPEPPPRKVRFAPKGPPRRTQNPSVSKRERADEDDNGGEENEVTEDLLRRVNEHLTGRRPKADKKSPVQVAFAHGIASSTSLRTYGRHREATGDRSEGSELRDSGKQQILLPVPASSGTDSGEHPESTKDASVTQVKEYKEPWDYHESYYPTTLPLRRPCSGDPELLDELEFGKATTDSEYDENTIKAASDLGFVEAEDEEQIIFFKLPDILPFVKCPAQVPAAERAAIHSGIASTSVAGGKNIAARSQRQGAKFFFAKEQNAISTSRLPIGLKGKETIGSSTYAGTTSPLERACRLEELPGGHLGKLLVYKSGAVKLKLGDFLFDVSPGSECIFAQDLVAINTVDRECCKLGEIGKRAVVTPDIDSLL